MAGTVNGSNVASLLEGSQCLIKAGTTEALQNVPNTNSRVPEPSRPFGSSIKMGNDLIHQNPPESRLQCVAVPANDIAQKCIPSGSGAVESLKSPFGPQSSKVPLSRDNLSTQLVAAETAVGRTGLSNIDLNNVYDDVQDHTENPRNSHPSWIQCEPLKSSPPQTSRKSDSTSTQSPSSSSGEAQVYYFSDLNSFPYHCIAL